MILLIPGRHHLFTEFQFKYLQRIVLNEDIDSIIFAVTSSNHSGTKRNPLPFYLRALQCQEFTRDLQVKSYIYGIDDVGIINDFSSYTLKQIHHQSGLKLTPENCKIVCSTPVKDGYEKLGFEILTCEWSDEENDYIHPLPWKIVEEIAENPDWKSNDIFYQVQTGSLKIWLSYNLDQKVRSILHDPIIGNDGDITETRDYNTYVKEMDEIADLKFQETRKWIKPGRIGDIGCAVGSWLKLVSEDNELHESDLYGIEITRKLFDICNQRKHNGEFSNPNIFFSQSNAVKGLVFEENSMDTIHTSSLTHEITSYGKNGDLDQFIQNRHKELKYGGVWINRDVIGPDNLDQIVYMWLNHEDGIDFLSNFDDLKQLSTLGRFIRFSKDFKPRKIEYDIHKSGDNYYIKLPFRDGAEFALTKDYIDNWNSEMKETFCHMNQHDWKQKCEKVGFQTQCEVYLNPWIKKNRFDGKIKFFDENMKLIDYPPSNILIINKKI